MLDYYINYAQEVVIHFYSNFIIISVKISWRALPPSPQMPPPLPSCLKETPSLLPPAARPSYRRRSGGVEEVLTVLESTSN